MNELPSVALTKRFLALCQDYGSERLAVRVIASGRNAGAAGLPESDDWIRGTLTRCARQSTTWNASAASGDGNGLLVRSVSPRAGEVGGAGSDLVPGKPDQQLRSTERVVREDWWQIPYVRGKEATSYPTQKPLALLDRIIKASSNPGDVVLDPFCGCATACVSAELLGREWIGIDLSPVAATLVGSRLRDRFGIFGEIHHRMDIPRRTDLGDLPNYRTHKHELFGKQEGHCGGCRMMFPFRNFEIDHVIP